MAGGWGCPHEVNDRCSKVNDLPCNPGMKGCTLAGRFRFANDEKNDRFYEKQARRAGEAAPAAPPQPSATPASPGTAASSATTENRQGFRMTFIDTLAAAWQKNDSLLCVGLDPDPAKFPAQLQGRDDAIFEFCRAIVDATADFVCSFKPQIAYFAARRAEEQLEALIAHIHENHPGIPVILDAKRGDIGSTAEQYAIEAFERYRADAITVNPYMGRDSVEPYLAYRDKGVILLCRTSNPGGSDLQFLDVANSGGMKLYERVAQLVAGEWNTSGQCALVVGATFPAEIRRVRELVGDLPLLVPGIGAQGGDIEATVHAGRTAAGSGLMMNSSRAILYAGTGDDGDYAAAARDAARTTRDAINRHR